MPVEDAGLTTAGGRLLVGAGGRRGGDHVGRAAEELSCGLVATKRSLS